MKTKQNILLVLMLCCSIGGWAQTQKEYFLKPVENVTICNDAGTYTWRGHIEIDNAGTYHDTAHARYEWQKDTIYTLVLKKAEKTQITYNWTMPKGGSITFRDSTFTEAGKYQWIIDGTPCDTIYYINIAYTTKYEFYEHKCFCGDTTFTWHRQTVSSRDPQHRTEFIAKYKSVHGYDSIYYLTVRFDPKQFEIDTTQYWCKEQLPFNWGTYRLDKECDTTQTFVSSCGCDSIVHLKLRLIPAPPKTIVNIDAGCASTGYFTRGMQLHRDTTISTTYPSWCGCDSVIDSVYTFLPGTGIHEEFRQHNAKDQNPYSWHGQSLTKDGYYYDTVPGAGPYGCDSIYRIHLVTYYEIAKSRSLCMGDTAHYKWSGGDSVVTKNSDFVERYKATTGGDSIVTFHFEFTPSTLDTVGEITIANNESFTWYYDPNDNKKTYKITTNGQPNTKGIQRFLTPPQKLDKCNKVVLWVNVVPYYLRDSVVYWCNDDPGEFIFTNHYHRDSVFNKNSAPRTTINDTLNAPYDHARYIKETYEPIRTDSILRFTFINSDRCSKQDTFHLCANEKIKIGGKWYDKTGDYRVNYTNPDSVQRFTIITAHVDTLWNDTLWLCESQIPYSYLGHVYTKTCDTVSQTKYAKQECDSVVSFLHVEVVPNRRADTLRYHFCTNQDIYVVTKTGKVIDQPGYYVDTLKGAWSYLNKVRCDSIYSYYISIDPAFLAVRYDSIKPYETYKWTYHNQDSILTAAGIYRDSTRTVAGCDSVNTLVLNWNKPYLDSTYATTCDNVPYFWRGNPYYQETHIVDTIWNEKKDTVIKLDLMVYPTYESLKTVALLPGKTYNFYGHVLTLKDTIAIKSVNLRSKVTGCDSIERVQIVPVKPLIIDTLLCPGQRIERPDIVNDQYADTIPNNGSWSVTIHQIIYDKKVISVISKQIRQGESYLWHRCRGDLTLTETGEYLDTCVKANGCDSIIKLKLIVGDDKLYSEKDSACANNLPYEWRGHGQWLDTTGIYYDRKTTSLGYDSVYVLDFKVIDPIHTNVKIDTCYTGQAIVINGRPYRKNTAFVDTFISVITHCDSIVHYILEMHYPVTLYEQKTLIEGNSFVWHGQTIDGGGVYYHHGTTPFGCDSTIILSVTECPQPVITYRTIHACEGDVVRINGDTIREPGTYTERNKTANGCDSIVQVSVTFSYTDWKYETKYLYQDDTITWRSKKYTEPGTYYDTIRDSYQCDSKIFCLYLQKVRVIERDTTVYSCDGTYYHKGKGPYFRDSVITDTIYNLDSKDSVYFKHHYRLVDHCSDYDAYYLCPGETRDIEGVIVSKSGNYFAPRLTAEGKDSLYRFTVRDGHVYDNTITLEGCDSIVYSGRTYLYPGTDEPFYQTLRHTSVKYGCDSIEHLILTIHSSKRQYDRISIGDFQLPYYYRNREYLTSCRDTFEYHTSPYGCDSLIILILQVLPTINDTSRLYYCKGDPNGIDIFGKKYYPEHDMVIDSLFHIGDDMVRRTAIVYVNQPFTIAKFDDHQHDSLVCAANALTFYVQYAVTDPNTGNLPTHYDVDFSVGNLDAHPKSATYETKGKTTLPIYMDGLGTCVQPGYYSYQIRFRSAGCPISDTTLTGNVLVRYPASIMEANWNNVVALVNENYNAGHWKLLPPYAWQVWDYNHNEKSSMVNPSDKTQPYIASNNLRENDVVIASLYREGYALPVPSCPFVFKPVNYVGSNVILVYPTAVKARTMVHVKSETSGEYQVYSSTGHKCAQGRLKDGDNTVQVPGSVGCYLMKVVLQDGTSATERLLVY